MHYFSHLTGKRVKLWPQALGGLQIQFFDYAFGSGPEEWRILASCSLAYKVLFLYITFLF